MLLTEILVPKFPSLLPSDPLSKARLMFLQERVLELPVVSDTNHLLGLLPLEMVEEIESKQGKVEDLQADWEKARIPIDQHGLYALELMSRYELSIIPVLDDQGMYNGVVRLQDVIGIIGDIYTFKEIGGIIVLKIEKLDYTLTEIARIVESNNAKIILMYMDVVGADEGIRMTIKVNTLDMGRILATFERYAYVIERVYPEDIRQDYLEERYRLMMKLFDL